MTDYAAESPAEAGTAMTQRTGTASADTIPAPCTLVVNNSGAGSHNVDLAIGYTWHGLSPGSAATAGKRRFVLSAGTWTSIKVPTEFGDASGRVAVAIDGTAGECKYFVLGSLSPFVRFLRPVSAALPVVTPTSFAHAYATGPASAGAGLVVGVFLVVRMTLRAVRLLPVDPADITSVGVLPVGDGFQVGDFSAVPDPAEMVKFGHFINVDVIGEGVGDAVDKLVTSAATVANQAIATFDQCPLPELAGKVQGPAKAVMGRGCRR